MRLAWLAWLMGLVYRECLVCRPSCGWCARSRPVAARWRLCVLA
jgi:hypothetical protein